jgi:Subtilase family
MADQADPPARTDGTGVVLAKLRSTERLFGAAGRLGVEPLRPDAPGAAVRPVPLDGRPVWFSVPAEPAASPWDQVHQRLAFQLGIDESDVLFVEPDLVHSIYHDDEQALRRGLAVGEDCGFQGQDGRNGKITGTGFAWHLDGGHTGLAAARERVTFSDPPTTIAHIDTGYSRHETRPDRLDTARQRNFVRADGSPTSARDPDNDVRIMDNSGHGTGTIGILAGGTVAGRDGGLLGGAPGAGVVPIRIADRVVLLRTSTLAMAIMYASDLGCEVASLSMGGLPSKAWAEAIDDAYERGLCLVAAAGNRVGEAPPRSIVYPARYDRVIAVTGAMADDSPYENLRGLSTLESVFGPGSAMDTAMAAYSPNIPWAKYGCPTTTRRNGEGTSAATPQVAAAAALWIEHYKDVLPSDWRRVEAVRHALFSSAKLGNRRSRFGNGILQADRALSVRPDLGRKRSKESRHDWAFARMLTGLFADGAGVREQMFNLELGQLWLLNPELGELVADPASADTLPTATYRAVLDVLIADPSTSGALREMLRARYHLVTKAPPPRATRSDGAVRTPPPLPKPATPPTPAYRRIRVLAKDPTVASTFATASVGEATVEIPWEPVEPTPTGFRGEYVEIVDDAIAPADDGSPAPGLDHPHLLAQDGWVPSPGNVHFHQQMVYGIAMKTIEHFERGLGRPVLWRPRKQGDPNDDSRYVRRLTLRPHALEEANAYYSPDESAILFGYFSPASQPTSMPVYTCLSYDIVAHETTHAVIDGMYRRFAEPTNIDVLAFHEAFADIVSLLQSFDMTELLEHQIGSSRGDLRAETLLGKLAVQLGTAARGREALRSAIGRIVDGRWVPTAPDPTALTRLTTPHERGAVLVSAVFDALIAIYEARTADLFRLATGGTGRLPDGAIHPDLTSRLAAEAAKSARHLLRMCIRALDYLPPVDITFFDFLRALVTADAEFVPDDRLAYRVAIVEAFIKRGIVPGESDASGDELRSLSADALQWAGFVPSDAEGATRHYRAIVTALCDYAERCVYIRDREELFRTTRQHRAKLNGMFQQAFERSGRFRRSLGLEPGPFEVHALRRAMRARPNGQVEPEAIVSLVQSRTTAPDPDQGLPAHRQLGGATIIVNLSSSDLPRYRIVKALADPRRRAAAARFAAANAADPLRALYLSGEGERFAALHHLADL